MGLRCSVFGHTFSETDTRRDREVRGDEVVTVVKTVERCSSCGKERVVSENKEVVSVLDAEEVDAADEAEAAAEPAAEEETAEAAPDETATRAEDADDTTTAETGDADDEGETETVDLDPDADPEEEDVEFITETDGSLGGGEEVDVDPDAEAPEGGIGGMAERSGAFGAGDGSEGSDPVPDTGDEASDEDAEILGEEERRSERAPGQWPEDPDATDEAWEPGELGGGPGTEPEPDEAVEEPAPVEPAPASSPEAEAASESLRCPGCGHTVPRSGSYRVGDACPECRADYLEAVSQ